MVQVWEPHFKAKVLEEKSHRVCLELRGKGNNTLQESVRMHKVSSRLSNAPFERIWLEEALYFLLLLSWGRSALNVGGSSRNIKERSLRSNFLLLTIDFTENKQLVYSNLRFCIHGMLLGGCTLSGMDFDK